MKNYSTSCDIIINYINKELEYFKIDKFNYLSKGVRVGISAFISRLQTNKKCKMGIVRGWDDHRLKCKQCNISLNNGDAYYAHNIETDRCNLYCNKCQEYIKPLPKFPNLPIMWTSSVNEIVKVIPFNTDIIPKKDKDE